MRLVQQIAYALTVEEREVDCATAHQLAARNGAVGTLLHQTEQLNRGLRRRHTDEGGLHRRERRKQLEHCGRNYTERAFSTDEQVFQVVAGVVLLELVERVQNAPVCQHHFEADHKVTRDTVSEGGGAARIGGQIASDRAAAFGGERDRKQTVSRRCLLLRLRE